MVEFVSDTLEGEVIPTVIHQAVEIASFALESAGVEIGGLRPLDYRERRNLVEATRPDGQVDILRFIDLQAADRQEIGIPHDLRTVSTLLKSCAAQDSGRPLAPYGYTDRDKSEAVVSIPNIDRELLHPVFRKYAAHFYAYTMAHKAGHLLGLVDLAEPRHSEFGHCSNFCIMELTSIDDTAGHIQETSGALQFCQECSDHLTNA